MSSISKKKDRVSMSFINSINHSWLHEVKNNNSLFFKGNRKISFEILGLMSVKDPDFAHLTNVLQNNRHFSSGVVETQDYVVSWVDHIRCWPVFYTTTNDKIRVSNHAQTLQETSKLLQLNEDNCLEFMMSGYVAGKETLYNELLSLEPGEFFVWDKTKKNLTVNRYYTYTPSYKKTDTEHCISKMDSILNELTLRIIADANGTKIWVPLSAGLDSRILLCKLHQHGYKNIETFTYGPKHNFEAIHARRIAKKLNVPWRMILLSKKEQKDLFDSDQRKEFWRFADGLKTIPCMREYSAIAYLHKNNIAKKGEIFINGQSGDYITGGHIPEMFFKPGLVLPNNLYEQLINKHYDLWFSLKTSDNLERIKDKISKMLPSNWEKKTDNIDRARQIEMWEYEGRQVCYVINGQRTYEFFGYKWEMPLWDKALVDLCETLSMEHKRDQYLYKKYLKEYNYMELFPQEEPYIWRWPMTMMWVIPLAQTIRLLQGEKKKHAFYARMRCYGHYANQFAFFPKEMHLKTYKNARSIISLYVPTWLRDNMLQDKAEKLD